METQTTDQTSDAYVAIGGIVPDPAAWPRFDLDQARVGEFMDLYSADGPGALPPVELIRTEAGDLLPGDGRHRIEAAERLGWTTIPARVIDPPPGLDPVRVAYEVALRTAAHGPLPLTQAERRAAIRRLLTETPELSDRQIGRLVGVAHTTVSRLRAGDATQQGGPGDLMVTEVSAAELAVRLLRTMERIRESRGLGLGDALLGDRMGQRLADALRAAYDDGAVERAEVFVHWFRSAIAALRRVA
jgi:ParB-like chromosome segregation protein Spo0J